MFPSVDWTKSFGNACPTLHRHNSGLRARYDAQIVKPAPPDLLFWPKQREIAYIADDDIMQPGVADAINKIYDRLALPLSDLPGSTGRPHYIGS